MIGFKRERNRKARPVPPNGVLDEAGEYYLENTLRATGQYGIKINSSHVKLDLNGYEIVSTNMNEEEVSFGIHVTPSVFVEVFNGKIRGSSIGINATYSNFLRIRDVHIEYCQMMGINFGGKKNIISNCTIRSIASDIDKALEGYAVGINTCESIDTRISYNHIENIYRQPVNEDIVGEGVGILLGHDSNTCDVSNNTISNNALENNTFGIWAVGKRHLIYKNFIFNHNTGIYTGDSKLLRNIIVLEKDDETASGVAGAMALCEKNIIVNYSTKYNNKLQEEVTPKEPLRII